MVGGGVACNYCNTLSMIQSETAALPGYEYLCINIANNERFICKLCTIYHPMGDDLHFIKQVTEVISTNADHQVTQIFLGVFKLYWNVLNDRAVNGFKSFLSDLELTQICDCPTHNKG